MSNSPDFRILVEKHQEKVRNTCFHFVNNPQDADDVAREVFVQVYQSLEHFRNESEISTWIYRIAVNKSMDFLRKKKRQKRFAQVITLFGIAEKTVENLPSATDSPDLEFEKNERKKILDHTIDRLPDNQATAIRLSKYEGFSNKEIAAIMDISLSAVEALLHRAKKNLKKKLRRYFEVKI